MAGTERNLTVRIDPRATHRNPNLWGPSVWALLLDAAYAVDEDPSERSGVRFLRVLDCLRTLLPCVHCRASYGPFLESLQPEEAVREQEALALVWGLKNLVHIKLGTGHKAISLDDLYDDLEGRRRSTDFDRALVRGVFEMEADRQGSNYRTSLQRCWPVWMELVDRRADLPLW